MTTATETLHQQLMSAISPVVFGVDQPARLLCVALIARGHVLVEGVPGLGKTLLAKTFAEFLGGSFKRIQGTSDLMPSDITGIHVFNSQSRQFELVPGPIFADVVLMDEINRTGPKTQSALLQAMEETAVTIDRNTYPLANEFLVLASQNPHEFEGTYPLPESQLDRFLLRIAMSYPTQDAEERVLRTYDRPGGGHAVQQTINSISRDGLFAAREQVAKVHVSDAVYRYVTSIAEASRRHASVNLGLSTRGALALMRCARVEASLNGRDYVTPDDVKAIALPVMTHRLVLTPEATLDGNDGAKIARSLLDQVAVPRS